MIKNTLSSLIIITIFLVGLFFVLPDNAFSQGCCQNAEDPFCTPNTNASECNNPGDIWFANDPVCVAGEVCKSYVGCCICNGVVGGDCTDGDICVGDLTQEECSDSGQEWVFGSCDDITACEEPVGCCQLAQMGGCTIKTEAECEASGNVADFKANVECFNANICKQSGIETGCCSLRASPGSPLTPGVSCLDDREDFGGECSTAIGTFVASLDNPICNDNLTCGQLGCCQFDVENGEPECGLLNLTNCGLSDDGGVWEPEPDSCTESGLCARNLLGCCVFGKNDCEDISALSCEVSDGKFELASCSEVPICNVVISPIPTLNQWGLIAMAGLLGLFSLFIIIRRHRYNLS